MSSQIGNAIIEEVLRLGEKGKNHYEIAKLFRLRNAGARRSIKQYIHFYDSLKATIKIPWQSRGYFICRHSPLILAASQDA